MPKGKTSPLPADQIEYLESHLEEFLEKKPRLGKSWTKVEKGWFLKWSVEDDLGLPAIDTHIEESELSEEQQTAVGLAQEKVKKTIHNWFKNRGQKEKKLLNPGTSNSVAESTLKDLVDKLGRSKTRIKHREELFQTRNKEAIQEALSEEGFQEAMGVSDEEETPEERSERVAEGRRKQMRMRRRVVSKLFENATEEERAAVETEYEQQKSGGALPMKSQTPEELQRGLNQLGPVLQTFHQVVERMTGWVGSTVLTGPTPNNDGKIATTRQNFDQAHPQFHEQIIRPLQQWGKKVFDHKTRREFAIQPVACSETSVPGESDSVVNSDTPETVDASQPPKRKRKRKAGPKKKKAATSANTDDDETGPPVEGPPALDAMTSLIQFGDDSPFPDDFSSLPIGDDIPIDPTLLGLGSEQVQPLPPVPTNTEPPARPVEDARNLEFELTSISANSSSHAGLSASLRGFVFSNEVPGLPRNSPPASSAVSSMSGRRPQTYPSQSSDIFGLHPSGSLSSSASFSAASPGRGRGAGRGGRGGAVAGERRSGDGDGQEVEGGQESGMEIIPAWRLREIRAFEKERDAAASRAEQNRDHGIFLMPPPPPGHAGLPHGPAALGRRVRAPEPEPISLGPRVRRPPTGYEPPPAKRTMSEIKAAAATRKAAEAASKEKATAAPAAALKDKTGSSSKRKASKRKQENDLPTQANVSELIVSSTLQAAEDQALRSHQSETYTSQRKGTDAEKKRTKFEGFPEKKCNPECRQEGEYETVTKSVRGML
ncbi:hypothetical protein B0H14DRAFT_2641377 [Mycena olivaceomarginata]|nr:hypothetical protein B0H14DRAFT_2641377 [Mycena olivaceomarginata]